MGCKTKYTDDGLWAERAARPSRVGGLLKPSGDGWLREMTVTQK